MYNIAVEQPYLDVIFDIPKRLDDSPFMMGCMDHTPTEIIERDKTYTSVFLFYTPDFHKMFEPLLSENSIKLEKWKHSPRYKEYFPSVLNAINEARLPYFVHAISAKGADIYNLKQHFVDQLQMNTVLLKMHTKNGERYDEYGVVENNAFKSMRLTEKASLAALYISHFIVRAYHQFKQYCEHHNIAFLGDPFILYHDKFPQTRGNLLPKITTLCASHSLHAGYSVREIMVANYVDRTSDGLFTDNICGYLHSKANAKDIDMSKEILPKNLFWERWGAC